MLDPVFKIESFKHLYLQKLQTWKIEAERNKAINIFYKTLKFSNSLGIFG